MSCRLFLSYRRGDTAGHAGRLYDHLCRHFSASDVFIDQRSIVPSSQFSFDLTGAVATCRVVIVLIGEQWLTAADKDGRPALQNPDDWVRRELEIAIEKKDVWVVPVTIDDANMPVADDLPPTLKPLAGYQKHTIRSSTFTEDVDRLVRSMIESGKLPRSISPGRRQLIAGLAAGGWPWSWMSAAVRKLGPRAASLVMFLAAAAIGITIDKFLYPPGLVRGESDFQEGKRDLEVHKSCTDESLKLNGYIKNVNAIGMKAMVSIDQIQPTERQRRLASTETGTDGHYFFDLNPPNVSPPILRAHKMKLSITAPGYETEEKVFVCGQFIPDIFMRRAQ